jgi:EAL domain-containing protein (putative c-di-GMP-specific phosphodiesterase class I)
MTIREPLSRGELTLHYQPILDLATGAVTSAEALLRTSGAESTQDLAKNAERDADHFELDQFIVHTACRDAASWRRNGLEQLAVHVNVSARELEAERFLALIDDALAESELDPTALQIEITETSAILDLDGASSILERLKARGVGAWLDDFGTGHSSLAWLNDFRVDGVKLPRELVSSPRDRARSAAIVRSVIALAHELSMFVIAEGVESEEDLELLRGLRCDAVQGFYLARPVSAQELFATVGRRRERR